MEQKIPVISQTTALASDSSIGMLAFGICIGIGQVVIGIAALILGGLPTMALVVGGKPRSPKQ